MRPYERANVRQYDRMIPSSRFTESSTVKYTAVPEGGGRDKRGDERGKGGTRQGWERMKERKKKRDGKRRSAHRALSAAAAMNKSGSLVLLNRDSHPAPGTGPAPGPVAGREREWERAQNRDGDGEFVFVFVFELVFVIVFVFVPPVLLTPNFAAARAASCPARKLFTISSGGLRTRSRGHARVTVCSRSRTARLVLLSFLRRQNQVGEGLRDPRGTLPLRRMRGHRARRCGRGRGREVGVGTVLLLVRTTGSEKIPRKLRRCSSSVGAQRLLDVVVRKQTQERERRLER